MSYFRHWVLRVSVCFVANGLSSASEIDVTAPVPEIGHGLVQGYLVDQKPINSVVFVPSPLKPVLSGKPQMTQSLMT